MDYCNIVKLCKILDIVKPQLSSTFLKVPYNRSRVFETFVT